MEPSSGWQADGLSLALADDSLKGEPDYYQILGVDLRAARLEIREAYLRLRSTFGSGSTAVYSLLSEDEGREQLALVEEAHRVLSDDIARQQYDRKMGFEATHRSGASWAHEGGFATSDDPVASATERLLFTREREELLNDALTSQGPQGSISPRVPEDGEPMTVRTTRSTLPIVRLKAREVGSESLRQIMADLIESHHLGDGALYGKLREAAQVSHEELQERIKVSIAYLRAIETNALDQLPQLVYVKGFLRSYFRYIGAPNAETMVTAFAEKLADWQAQRSRRL